MNCPYCQIPWDDEEAAQRKCHTCDYPQKGRSDRLSISITGFGNRRHFCESIWPNTDSLPLEDTNQQSNEQTGHVTST